MDVSRVVLVVEIFILPAFFLGLVVFAAEFSAAFSNL